MHLALIPAWMASAYQSVGRPLSDILTLEKDYTELTEDHLIELNLTTRDIEWYVYLNRQLHKLLPLAMLQEFDYGRAESLGMTPAFYQMLDAKITAAFDPVVKDWSLTDYHTAILSPDSASKVPEPFEYTALQPTWLNDTTVGLLAIDGLYQPIRKTVDRILYHLYQRTTLQELIRTRLFTYYFQLGY